jgi:hypothetical protein
MGDSTTVATIPTSATPCLAVAPTSVFGVPLGQPGIPPGGYCSTPSLMIVQWTGAMLTPVLPLTASVMPASDQSELISAGWTPAQVGMPPGINLQSLTSGYSMVALAAIALLVVLKK